jgi:hypothetical protein
MTPARRFPSSVAVGVVLAVVAAGRLAACSAIDPNPPDPHVDQPGPGAPLKTDPPSDDAPDAASDGEAGR